MGADQIPENVYLDAARADVESQELVDILNKKAGKEHSRTGAVLTTLAEILTRYEQIRIPEEPINPGV
jgi:hypothetical protein